MRPSLHHAFAQIARLGWPAELAVRVALALLTPIVAIAVLVPAAKHFTELPDGVALRVGDTDITEADLAARTRLYRALYGVRPPPANDPQANQFARAIARTVALQLVLDRGIAARGLQSTGDEARDALRQMTRRQYGPDDPGGFALLLGQVGASEQDVLAELGRQRGVARLYAAVTGQIAPVTDEEVTREYQHHPERAVAPERRNIRNIVVPDEQRARQVVAEAQSGTDFATLVGRYSVDASTRSTAGELGLTTADRFEPEYARLAFSTPPGSVFGPVHGSHGWNVGQVLAVQPAVALPSEQVRDALREELTADRRDRQWRSFIADELTRAQVRYADKYRPGVATTQDDVSPPAATAPLRRP